MADSPTPQQAFRTAVEKAGSQSAFARLVGCTPGNISQLLNASSVLPDRYVLKAEATTGISRHELRPDLYPDESDRPALRPDRAAPAAPADDLAPAR